VIGLLASFFMSSDTYTIHVTKIDGDKVEFHCFTGTAGGLNDYCVTRSFALMIIEDGMPYAEEAKGTPLQKEMRLVSGASTPPVWERDFHTAHVGKFIANCKLVKRMGIIKDVPAWQHGRFELENYDNYPLHQFIFHVQVTDPKWLKGLKQGSRYGTTAFDAWWDDRTRQSDKELRVIERAATVWTPPGTLAAEKDAAPAKKLSAPKRKAVAVKKAAAKKAPAAKRVARVVSLRFMVAPAGIPRRSGRPGPG